MASKHKHTTCTIKDKLEAIKRLGKGESVSKLPRQLTITGDQLSSDHVGAQ